MRILELTESNTRLQIKGNAILMNRVGPINAQKQTHTGHQAAPTKRGMWAFPYPYFEWFFASHVLNKGLPKRLDWRNYREASQAYQDQIGVDQWIKEYKEAMDHQWSHFKIKQFWWNKPFYSRLYKHAPYCTPHGDGWYRWTEPREFAKFVAHHAPNYKSQYYFDDGTGKVEFGADRSSKDHLEVFCPM